MKHIVEILQLSIAPVVLISGVGLIILSQTNRMANIISRIRWLKKEIKQDEKYREQALLLYRRSSVIRISLIALILCIFFDSVVILIIFIGALSAYNPDLLIIIFFSLSLVSLIIGLAAFLYDVNLNLQAIEKEVDRLS